MQIVIRLYSTISEVLLLSDIDSCALAYDGRGKNKK